MKKLLILALTLVVALSVAVMAADSPSYQSETYVGYVQNDHGDVVIKVRIERNSIVDVNMLNPFADKVVENQGNVDVVSGATPSGHSYNDALDQAMIQAGLK